MTLGTTSFDVSNFVAPNRQFVLKQSHLDHLRHWQPSFDENIWYKSYLPRIAQNPVVTLISDRYADALKQIGLVIFRTPEEYQEYLKIGDKNV